MQPDAKKGRNLSGRKRQDPKDNIGRTAFLTVWTQAKLNGIVIGN